MMKVSAGLVPLRAPREDLPGLSRASPCLFTSSPMCVCPLFNKDTSHIGLGSIPKSSF